VRTPRLVRLLREKKLLDAEDVAWRTRRLEKQNERLEADVHDAELVVPKPPERGRSRDAGPGSTRKTKDRP
jgi:hypothetical protein